ncbi:Hypothetical predicted protein [Mytilus galloprovincialis]|uniref:Uncharacterized protein n=1 Tax=Mytilus galloprovincialis TaxID=29158 RepID=A0A8B6CNS8_MYTGA|nr:Hypothetical predicted protein [Mytilus galloprovincialis]
MGKFTDICEVCSNPKPVNIVFVAPNGASVDCNLPSHCECCQNCTACAVCDIKANIPKACNERPRQLYQTENNNKKTWMRRYARPQRITKMYGLYGKKQE